MTASAIQSLILSTLTQFGVSVLAIITAVIGVAVAYLVFKFGWKRVITDQSLMIGGFYLRNTPYKGYNRWRSKKWNMEHTM